MGEAGSTGSLHQKPDLADGALLSCLRDAYGLHPREVTFLPLGADPHSAVYRLLTEDGRAYFLKLRGGPDETSVVVPGLLGLQGLRQVIPPVPATAGQLWTTVEGFALVLYPFVEGEDGYAVPLSDAQWVELGAAVRGIHRARLPPPVGRRIPRETFTPAWRETLGGFLSHRGGGRNERDERFEDDVAAGLVALLRAERGRMSGALERAEQLAQALRTRQRPQVLCHGDLHAGNVLLATGGALHLIDWDTLVFAPRERDFEQIGGAWGGERERGLFFEGYGAIEIDQTALAYYRYWRIMEDLVVACEQVLATGGGGANRERELEIVRQSLLPGRALDVATRLDRGQASPTGAPGTPGTPGTPAGRPSRRGSTAARGAEAKPAWQEVPAAVRAAVERTLGARVRRAVRTWGGYAPSATFRLFLDDGRPAFFKASYPPPADSPLRFSIDREERAYRDLVHLLAPWAPAFYGSVRVAGWHGLLLEDVGPATVPPWTRGKARAALAGYGAFHRASAGASLPRWLPRAWRPLGEDWQRLLALPEGPWRLAGLAGGRAPEAAAWLGAHSGALDRAARALARAPGPYALLHLDTRSDNLRVRPRAAVPLRVFDWPAAIAGPPELDLAFFVQSVVEEGGPAPEALVRWYASAQPVRAPVLAHAVATVAGFFALRAWQPEIPALPRLRSVQRRQLRASLRWAAHLLALPDPAWLQAVPA